MALSQKVLLTGGSGFIASHVLDVLLQRGHTVVTTVRSQEKANKIRNNHPNVGDKLQFSIVEDIAQPNAFDKAVISDPPFDAVIHTASPFHFNITDIQKDLLDPAVIGTTGVLKAIKKSASSVKRVVITSSFAAIGDVVRKAPNHVYNESDWNGVTVEDATKSSAFGYRASKTFAEKAAWEFVEQEKPNFNLATINPPLVFGPIHPGLQSLDSLNTSNTHIYKFLSGANKEVPPAHLMLYVDVRDAALAHVLAAEKKEAGGQRFFVTGGHWSTKQVAEIIEKNFPEFASKLPPKPWDSGALAPEERRTGYDNSRSRKVLGIEYLSFEQSCIDTIKSLKAQM